MKNLILIAALSITILLQSCVGFNCIEGTGAILTEEVDLDIIKEIENNSAVNVEIKYGQNQKVEITGHRNHIDMLLREVKSDRWVIDFTESVCYEDMSIRVTMPEIRAIEIDGSGDVIASTPFQTKNFDVRVDGSGDVSIDISAEDVSVDIDGSGDVSLNGYADEFTIEIDGSGDLKAYDLEAKEAYIDSDGSGDVQVSVKEILDAKIKGSGNITYKGDPEKMEFTQKGSGKISKK